MMDNATPYFQLDKFDDLWIDEVFVWYAVPQVFTCKNAFGHVYIVVASDLDEYTESWFITPISLSRLNEIKRRKLDLYTALTEPEDGSVSLTRIVKDFSTGNFDFETCDSNEIDPIELPTPGHYIEADVEGLPPVSEVDIEETVAERRDEMILSLSNERHAKEIDANTLGLALISVQKTVTSMLLPKNKLAGRTPKVLVDKSALDISGFKAASFAVQLRSSESSDLLGSTPVSNSLIEFVNIISNSTDPTTLAETLANKNARVAANLVDLFKVVVGQDLSLSLRVTTTNRKLDSVSMNADSMRIALNNLKLEVEGNVVKEKIIGVLDQINVSGKKFTLINQDTDEKISGEIRVSQTDFSTGVLYEFEIETEIVTKQATSSNVEKHYMVGIREVEI